MSTRSTSDRATAKREYATALLACVAGAVLALLASGRVWLDGQAVAGSLRAPLRLTGSSLAPAAPALALAALAGALGVVATRGLGRRLAGVVLIACGAGVCAVSARAAQASGERISGRAGDALGTATATAEGVSVGLWPWVAVAGGTVVVVAGLLVAARGPGWATMSSRYDAPQANRVAAPVATARPATPLEQWKALDRGEDPTT